MRLRIRTPLSAVCLLGLAAVPTHAAGPAFAVAFSSASGALAQAQVQGPTRIQIQERPALGSKPGRHVLKLTFQDDGTNLAGRIRQSIAGGDPVSAVITFSADAGPLASRHTRLTLGAISRVAGWNDDDDEPGGEDDGQIQLRCEYSTFSAERVAPPPPPGDSTGAAPGTDLSNGGSAPLPGDGSTTLPGGSTGTTNGTTVTP